MATIKERKRWRMEARHLLGNSREDLPTIPLLFRALHQIDKLLRESSRQRFVVAVIDRKMVERPLSPENALAFWRGAHEFDLPTHDQEGG